jgi:tetratricopeptide (TPR) repeat protein
LLARERLALGRLLDIALPLADALAYAHSKGVVHRDLKPGNVMLSGLGVPKVLDFGLAKVIEPAASSSQLSTQSQLTDYGVVVGTVGYMSPEQALGKEVDERSDVFAFGALLYEMAAGVRAFAGATSTQVLDRVLHGEPKPLAQMRPDLPGELTQVVEKALRKDPAERYQHMADLAADLRHVRNRSGAAAPARSPTGTPSHRQRRALAIIGAAIAAVFVGFAMYRTYAPGSTSALPNSIAVMNFENLADRTDADNTARMLTSLIITELSGSGQLDVVSSQRLHDIARQLGHTDGPPDRSVASQVARRAGARTMVVGELAQVGERTVATTELVDIESGRLLGSPKAEGTRGEDIFSMAETLGAQLRQRIAPPAPGAPKVDLIRQLTGSVDAYRAFVRGETFYQRLDLEKAYEQFREATELDGDFALAQYRLSGVAAWLGREAENREAAARAVALLPRLPAAFVDVVRANALFSEGRYGEARPILDNALARDPENKDAAYLLSEIYAHSARDNNPARTLELLERVLRLDPDYRLAYTHVVAALIQQGEMTKARQKLDDWERVEPEVVQLVRSLLRAIEGRPAEALELARGVTTPFFRPWRAEFAIMARRWELAGELVDEDLPPGWISAWMARTRGNLDVYRGRFDSARKAYRQAAAGARQHDGVEGGVSASALESLAMLLMLTGDIKAARTEAERAVSLQPEGPRWRYFAGTVALRDHDPSAAATHLKAIQGLIGVGQSPLIGLYNDGLQAEIALAQGRARDALPLFEKLQSSMPLLGFEAAFSTAKPAFRDGLARAYLALGEKEKAAAALEALLSSGFERITHPVLYVRALYTLAKLKAELKDQRAAAKLLTDFLDHWGNAGRDLREVRDARSLLRAMSPRASAAIH